MSSPLQRLLALVAVSLTAGLAGCADLPPVRAVRIATAATSEVMCNAAFVSRLDPQRAADDEMRPAGGMGLIAWGLRSEVDAERHEVRTTFAGQALGRATWREGGGCTVVHGDAPLPPLARTARVAQPDPFPGLAVPAPVPARDPRLAAAVDAAFQETAGATPRRTQAVLVVQHGRILAERYADDIRADTPLAGHSISKSVVHALVGVLVRQGRLNPDAPLQLPAWQTPGDPRATITPNLLLANASGLPWDEANRGWDGATRMWHVEPDPAAFAMRVPAETDPGTFFAYSNAGWTVLSRVLRDLNGGSAEGFNAFAERELMAPLGMRDTVLTIDATGTPMGANLFFASARDWARFGLLYLNDGVVNGRRLLPEGWVHEARTPTLDAGYGRGFWLNHRHDRHPLPGHWGLPGAPSEAFFARGYLGQFIVIVPSLDLVIVRLGVSYRQGGDVETVGRLVGEVVAVLRGAAIQPSK
ncbi:MAG TPA: serine hydrolase [Ideonella sp.]|uniref:serine hydrolase domain-containing protein n=1 Tax=Ideonella sp. TaxID=1929293 RepID=UPI002E36857C|nr:serine hydrolase [Ideonella sp.]HEX5687624.1 serine hydrolase [Ideonella sp.]